MFYNITNVLLLMGALLCTINQAHSATEQQPQSVVFIENAESGLLTPIDGKPDYYQLKLSGLDRFIPFIISDPLRASGIYPTERFFSHWEMVSSHSNATATPNKIPPTTILSGSEQTLFKEQMVNLTVELSSPIFDHKANTALYTLHVLKGAQTYIPTHELRNVFLFIDDFCSDCSGQHF